MSYILEACILKYLVTPYNELFFRNTFHCFFYMYIHSSIFVPTLYSILTLSFVFCFLLPPRLSVLNILYLLLMDTHMNPTCDTPCGADRRCLLQTSLVSISSGRARPSVVLCRALLDFTTKKIWAVHFQIVNHFSQTDVKSNNNSHKEELTNMPN